MWGLLFVAGAAFIILASLGYVRNVSAIKIIFTVVFAGIIISNIPYWNFWGIFIPLAGICIIYSETWGIQKLSPWPLVAIAVLLSAGFSLIFKSGGKKYNNQYYSSRNYGGNQGYGGNQNYGGSQEYGNSQNQGYAEGQDNSGNAGWETEYIEHGVNNTVDCSVKFSSAIKYVKMNNLERANINLSFGAIEVYFDGSAIPSGRAQIDIDGKFGSIVLYIPKEWKVNFQTSAIAGSVNEKNRPQLVEASPEVVISGNIQFGSVEIQYI